MVLSVSTLSTLNNKCCSCCNNENSEKILQSDCNHLVNGNDSVSLDISSFAIEAENHIEKETKWLKPNEIYSIETCGLVLFPQNNEYYLLGNGNMKSISLAFDPSFDITPRGNAIDIEYNIQIISDDSALFDWESEDPDWTPISISSTAHNSTPINETIIDTKTVFDNNSFQTTERFKFGSNYYDITMEFTAIGMSVLNVTLITGNGGDVRNVLIGNLYRFANFNHEKLTEKVSLFINNNTENSIYSIKNFSDKDISFNILKLS